MKKSFILLFISFLLFASFISCSLVTQNQNFETFSIDTAPIFEYSQRLTKENHSFAFKIVATASVGSIKYTETRYCKLNKDEEPDLGPDDFITFDKLPRGYIMKVTVTVYDLKTNKAILSGSEKVNTGRKYKNPVAIDLKKVTPIESGGQWEKIKNITNNPENQSKYNTVVWQDDDGINRTLAKVYVTKNDGGKIYYLPYVDAIKRSGNESSTAYSYFFWNPDTEYTFYINQTDENYHNDYAKIIPVKLSANDISNNSAGEIYVYNDSYRINRIIDNSISFNFDKPESTEEFFNVLKNATNNAALFQASLEVRWSFDKDCKSSDYLGWFIYDNINNLETLIELDQVKIPDSNTSIISKLTEKMNEKSKTEIYFFFDYCLRFNYQDTEFSLPVNIEDHSNPTNVFKCQIQLLGSTTPVLSKVKDN